MKTKGNDDRHMETNELKVMECVSGSCIVIEVIECFWFLETAGSRDQLFLSKFSLRLLRKKSEQPTDVIDCSVNAAQVPRVVDTESEVIDLFPVPVNNDTRFVY